MQRESKSVHLGAAFFLCLGLAIIPVSLQVAGVPLTLSPRLAAALEVWGQISDAFEGSYQHVAPPELAAVQSPDADHPATQAEASGYPGLACSRSTQTEATSRPQPAVATPRTGIPRRRCTGAAQRRAIECTARRGTRELRRGTRELMIRVPALDAALVSTATALGELRSLKGDAGAHLAWLKVLEKEFRQRAIEVRGRARSGEIPETPKVLVRVKAPVASGSAAACKVRTAMAAATGIELQRAGLFDDQLAGADLCDF